MGCWLGLSGLIALAILYVAKLVYWLRRAAYWERRATQLRAQSAISSHSAPLFADLADVAVANAKRCRFWAWSLL